MGEITATGIDKLKSLFHKEIKAKTEIKGGTWDPKANIYSTKDEQTGVTTEYKLKKNDSMETGLSARITHYQDVADKETGQLKKTEVFFDKKTETWITKSPAAKAMEALKPKPKYMAVLTEVKSPGVTEKIHNLVIAPAKYKPNESIPPTIIIPPPPPPPSGSAAR